MSEQSKYRAVLFDWNGTLGDMSALLEQDKYVGRVEFGLELTDEDIRACWGLPPQEFLPKLFGRGGDKRPWQEIRDIFYQYDHLFPRGLRPETLEVLDILDEAQVITGVVTSWLREKVLAAMQQGNLSPDRFRLVHTHAEIGDDIDAGRPILGKALGGLALQGIASSEVLFVGDETATMHYAQAAGVDYAVVLGGAFSQQRLLNEGVPSHRIIEDLRQLPGVLGIKP